MKIYEYNGKHYCDKDISLEDDLYAGDLFCLYFDASHGDHKSILCESTVYYHVYDPETTYESPEDLVESYFDDCVIGEV